MSAESERLSGKVGLNTDDFKTGLAQMNRELRVLESSFRASAAGLRDWANDSSGLELRIKTLTSQIDIQRQKVTAVRAEYERMAAEKGATSRAAQDLQIKLNRETETLNRMERELTDTQDALNDVGDESENTGKETDKLRNAEDKASSSTKKLAINLGGLKTMAGNAVKGIASLTKQASEFAVKAAVTAAKVVSVVAVAAGALLASTVGPASDLQETLNKTGVVFIEMTSLVTYHARQAAESVGLSQKAYLEYASSIAAALKAGGMGVVEATQISERAVKNFADLASFHNAKVEDVAAAWQSAIRGSYEPIQKFFPFITDEYLKTYGTANGLIDKNTKTLTANQRAIILDAIALDEELNPALDDFSETSGGLANQQRILGANLSNLKATIGQAVLPIVQKLVTALNQFLSSETAQKGIETLTGLLGKLGFALGELFNGFQSGDFDLSKIFEMLIGGFAKNKTKLLGIGITIIKAFIDGVSQALPTLLPLAQQLIEKLVEFVTQTLPGLLPLAINILLSLINFIVDNLPLLINTGVDLLLTLVNTILENLPMLIEAGLQLILTLALAIAEALPELIPTIVDVLITVVETLIDNLPMLIDAALKLILGLATGLILALPKLIPAIPKIIKAIFDAIIQALPVIFKAAGEIIGALVAGIIENLPLIIKAAYEIIQAIYDAIGPKAQLDLLINIGKGLIEGIWDGWKSHWDSLVANITSNFLALWEYIKDLLGIKSPSKLFGELGKFSAMGFEAGFMKGFEQMQRNLVPAFRNLEMNLSGAGDFGNVARVTNNERYSFYGPVIFQGEGKLGREIKMRRF